MDLEALAALAEVHGNGHGPGFDRAGPGNGRGPGVDRAQPANGQGPGLVAGRRPHVPLRGRSRAVLLRLLGRKEEVRTLRSQAFQAQAKHANRTGRNRTKDFMLPQASTSKRPVVPGRGKWKQWTPEAVLRAAFADENAGVRHVAAQVDGGSAAHSAECKFFVSELIMRGQKDGLANFLQQAKHDAGADGMDFALTNMIFDETELEINLHSFGVGSWSVLASHAQMTFKVNEQIFDFDLIRPPMALPNKQACTMWPALCAGEGGLWPSLSEIPAKYRAILVTCDAAPANIKLLGHLEKVMDDRTLLLPFLCLQHRTGNVVERVTKFLSVLTGSFAVAKTLRSGFVVKRLVSHVRDILRGQLVVLDQVPHGSAAEWASGQVCAQRIFALVRQGSDERAEGAGFGEHKQFCEFFAGPWTGLGVERVGYLSFSCCWRRGCGALKSTRKS